ncbi:LOW QUALITY PROTEIN: hypothetical protein V1477_008499 [Vespula maculifrons]|uniref:Uncharacterized protein n=1 Tax=Vespula maculifrons TaxID=7453 RepID=A0ABD2CD72_VESMC
MSDVTLCEATEKRFWKKRIEICSHSPDFLYKLEKDFNMSQSISVGLLFAPENTSSVPADIGVSVLPILPRTLADISKSIKRRRSRREREEKKAGTCAHVKRIEFGRDNRRHIRQRTRARVRTMKWKRKDGHRIYTRPKPEYENRARFFDTERRKPAQKPTPTSPTHRSHPKEIRIMDLEYLFPSIGKINQTESFTVGLLLAPENTTSVPADIGVSVLSILPRTLADISKFIKRRRSRRERKEKKAGTCAHVKTIEFGRKERITGRRPAQKPTPMSPTHETHPRESLIINLYCRPRSHREEVAASGDPRANGDSTLSSTIRDAFPLRELRASQQTGDKAPPSTPSASDISRHDRSCLFRFQKSKRSPRQKRDFGKILKYAAIRPYIANTTDPGPTTRRLLHLRTHGLTGTLL